MGASGGFGILTYQHVMWVIPIQWGRCAVRHLTDKTRTSSLPSWQSQLRGHSEASCHTKPHVRAVTKNHGRVLVRPRCSVATCHTSRAMPMCTPSIETTRGGGGELARTTQSPIFDLPPFLDFLVFISPTLSNRSSCPETFYENC